MSAIVREASWLMTAGATQCRPEQLRAKADPELNWRRLLDRAEFERAFPVVADRLRDSGVAMPAAVEEHVRSRAMVSEFAISRLHATLDRAIATLAPAGIRVLLIKGVALSRTRYPSRRLRPMGDIDLLIEPDQIERAVELLRANGWQTRHDPLLDEFFRTHHHVAPLYESRGGGPRIELHHDLFFEGHPFHFGADAMWRDARPVPGAIPEVWVPSVEHLLLHCCIHFAWGHTMLEGGWTAFRDIAVLAEAPDLDWSRFIAAATQARAATTCYWSMRLANRLVHAGVPAEVLERLAPALPEAMLERLTGHFASRVLGAIPASNHLERAIWTFAMQPQRSGHGAIRPWDHDEDFTPATTAAHTSPLPDSLVDRTRRGIRRFGDSMRCLTDLALGRSGREH